MKERTLSPPFPQQDAQEQPRATKVLAQVSAPHFVAGIVCDDYRCLAAAPVLGWMVGRQRAWIREYVKARNWKIAVVLELVE